MHIQNDTFNNILFVCNNLAYQFYNNKTLFVTKTSYQRTKTDPICYIYTHTNVYELSHLASLYLAFS